MPLAILAYHSHHVVGAGYEVNDHVAFARDLDLLTNLGWTIVPLSDLVAAHAEDSKERLVALTFDDGPVYDVDDVVHPELGPQRSFAGAMRDFAARRPGAQPRLHATSFVIASPEGRLAMEASADATYTWLAPGALSESWWLPAIESGLIAIANHSWDHLHPALAAVRHSRGARGDFAQVDTATDADAQVRDASAYLWSATRGRSLPYFAYPFGHHNAFLARDYLPSVGAGVCAAAFTTEPRLVVPGDSRFLLPRFVCGADWRSPEALARLLA
ncbi:MAG: polysaccharide deacetylase family protein [Burkholderiales bacterium]|jgi:peptidoglycan/xylan/chitin deacetylase (PgdA/CDA1 family)|nr:polysaccharide deacetylase family protein [Burkholderiales bacterium]